MGNSNSPDNTLFKHVVHLDEKVIKPNDKIGSVPIMGEDSEVKHQSGQIGQIGQIPPRPHGLNKSIIGRPKIYDLDGNLLASEENLVVITGREFLAQLIAKTQGDNPLNMTNYQITYFGVGDGGSSNACPPTTVGPYDDDVDLGHRVVIKDPNAQDPFTYISGGTLKRILFDGEVKVVSEEHTINVPTGGQKVIDAYTAIRYRMYLQTDEPKNKPFRFNEAGLYAVEYVFDSKANDWLPTDNHVLFARFTTLDKWLDAGDGIMIEWYILV